MSYTTWKTKSQISSTWLPSWSLSTKQASSRFLMMNTKKMKTRAPGAPLISTSSHGSSTTTMEARCVLFRDSSNRPPPTTSWSKKAVLMTFTLPNISKKSRVSLFTRTTHRKYKTTLMSISCTMRATLQGLSKLITMWITIWLSTSRSWAWALMKVNLRTICKSNKFQRRLRARSFRDKR